VEMADRFGGRVWFSNMGMRIATKMASDAMVRFSLTHQRISSRRARRSLFTFSQFHVIGRPRRYSASLATSDLVENLQGHLVKLPKFAKYGQVLKNSVATKETATEKIFLMKDLTAVEEAVGLGAKIVEGDVAF
jgi:hypothetical protein